MPTLSTADTDRLTNAVNEVCGILTGEPNADDMLDCINILEAVQRLLLLAENPDGTPPHLLKPGDRLELDGDIVMVVGYPWTSGDTVCVPVDSDTGLLFLPAHMNTATL